ncbi:PadR family transcriptional regulator [Clostridium sp. LY3-2]|uniref:PadR family transcriptional regulator n=1 Tax=Clostridium sp. LY3-2 TaxID=2942482 RepID=UPI00215398A5|nr:PadR family transcriptional regulator [Clostridium sp. LY3-2]MCR6515003.1 PadR family transcriptional regulator [Clostridium sp. LY3-2]
MDDLNLLSEKEIRAEEKRLYEEYKKNLLTLKKKQNTNSKPSGQVFTKGLLPIYVLHILSLGPISGNEISNIISDKTKGKWHPSTGGIYPLLKKLETAHLVVGEWDDPEKKFRKTYSLTPSGFDEYERIKILLKPKIEEALEVFKIIYKDIY